MTDRELLELAAKAAGYVIVKSVYHPGNLFLRDGRNENRLFNPLTDDGDAFRMAVQLRLHITFSRDLTRGQEYIQVAPATLGHLAEFGQLGSDPGATIRRAIVRAAAAMAPKETA